jgi:hypothetical protein
MHKNHKTDWTRREQTQRPATMPLLMLILTLHLTGCVTRTLEKEISPNRAVVTVHAGVPFVPPVDGKFVPEERFVEMLEVYIREANRK